MTTPAETVALTLKLGPEAVEALSLAVTWFRGELYKLQSGRPAHPTVERLYDDLMDETGLEGDEPWKQDKVKALVTEHMQRLTAIDFKLTQGHERVRGVG